jgi:hypothetical protein
LIDRSTERPVGGGVCLVNQIVDDCVFSRHGCFSRKPMLGTTGQAIAASGALIVSAPDQTGQGPAVTLFSVPPRSRRIISQQNS